MQLRNDQVKREEMFDLFVLKSKRCFAVPFIHSLPREDDLSKQIQKFNGFLYWWLLELAYRFKAVFCLKIWGFLGKR